MSDTCNVHAPTSIGTSVEGRPLIVDRFGSRGPLLFVLAGIHGDEQQAVVFGERLRARLMGGWAERRDVRVLYLGAANPDGIERDTRHNARDVDLNRNFPTDNFDPDGAGGSTPLSEPESEALATLVESASPNAVVSAHCCEPMLDHDGRAAEMAAAMHEAMPEPYRFPLDRLGPQPGSMGSWIGVERETPIVTLEFAAVDTLDLQEQYKAAERAVDAAMDWLHTTRDGARGETWGETTSGPSDACGHYGYVPTTSAGGEPIRLESTTPLEPSEEGLQGEISHLILGGWRDTASRSLHVAEHVRRVVHVQMQSERDDGAIATISSANPDGVASQSSRNADGIEVARALPASGPSAPEAALVWRCLVECAPEVVVVVEADDESNSVVHWRPDRERSVEVPPPFQTDRLDARLDVPTPSWIRPFLEHGCAVLRLGVACDPARKGRGPASIPMPTRFSEPCRAWLAER